MPEQSVIVWDLETIVDLAAAARMLDLGAATETEVRGALGPSFPKHPLHKIVCIGALVASRQSDGWRMDALGASHVGERTEAELIGAFAERVGQLRPQLVTWNGHSFDLPVLRYRAMVNRVAAAGLQVRQHFHRYTDDALDLCDVLGSYVPGGKVKLDEVASPRALTAAVWRRWCRPGRSRKWLGIARAMCSIPTGFGKSTSCSVGLSQPNSLPGVRVKFASSLRAERRLILTCVRRSASRRVVTCRVAVAATERGEPISSYLLRRSCRLEAVGCEDTLQLGTVSADYGKMNGLRRNRRLSLLLPEGH